jgi:hypothetical protein
VFLAQIISQKGYINFFLKNLKHFFIVLLLYYYYYYYYYYLFFLKISRSSSSLSGMFILIEPRFAALFPKRSLELSGLRKNARSIPDASAILGIQ